MRSSIFVLIVFALIAAVATGFAWRDAAHTSASNAARTALAAQRAQADISAGRAVARVTDAQRRRTELRAALDALAKTAAPKIEARTASASARAVTQSEVIATDPKVQALALVVQRANAADRYAMFFRGAGLSPAQIERFLDNMMHRDTQMMDLEHTTQAQGLKWNDPAVQKLTTQTFDDYNAAQQELLGSAGQQQLRDFERTTPVRAIVGDLAGAATIAGVPFTTAQIDQLSEAFAASAGTPPGRPIDFRKIDWARVETSARTFLSPAQLEFFTTMDAGEMGGRFSMQFKQAVDAARKADARPPSSKSSSGGP